MELKLSTQSSEGPAKGREKTEKEGQNDDSREQRLEVGNGGGAQ